MQENSFFLRDSHLTLLIPGGAMRCVPVSSLTELSVSQLDAGEGRRWVVAVDLSSGQRVRLMTFAPDAGEDALERGARMAGQCFAPGHAVRPIHSQPTSDQPLSELQGRCLQHVTHWGTQFVPVSCVDEIHLQAQTPLRCWQVVAKRAGKSALSLAEIPMAERVRAEHATNLWAMQIFDALAQTTAVA